MASIKVYSLLLLLSLFLAKEAWSEEIFTTTTFKTTGILDESNVNNNNLLEDKNTFRDILTGMLRANETNSALGNLKQTFFKNIRFNRKFSPKDCLLCRFSASLLQYAVQTSRGKKKVEDIARTICTNARYESEQVCSSIAKVFSGEVSKVLAYALFTPDQICGFLSDNNCGHLYDPFGDWEISLEASEHLDLDTLHQYDIDEKMHQLDLKNKAQTSKYRVIHISDTHVDLNYAEGSISHCEEPLCCQTLSTKFTGTLNRLDNVLDSPGPTLRTLDMIHDEPAGHWGSYSNCDIPIRTFEQLLMNLNETIKKHHEIDYIIWTGDIQPHDVWKQTNESAIKTFDEVFLLVDHYLPKIKIFPTLGNHEMVPVDSFVPSNLWNVAEDEAPSWVYKEFSNFWHKWLPRSTEATILKDGNYAAIARPGLKIISLNTNYCHDKNFWLYINSTDPGNQLQWLVHELQISELLQEKVHIIGHIPPGADDCLKMWSRNFNRILRRFKNTVSSQFYGHTHFNEFQIFYDLTKKQDNNNNNVGKNVSLAGQDYINASLVPKSEPTNQEIMEAATLASAVPISVGFVGPSATTFIGLNPSYRIYTISPLQGFLPIDFDTYYLNLTAANEMSKLHPPRHAKNLHNLRRGKRINSRLLQTTSEDPIRLNWVHGGSFARTFNLSDVSPESMHKLITNIGRKLFIKERVPDSLKSLMTRLSEEEDQRDHHWKKEPEKDDDLYKLYRLYNGYSDLFGSEQYAQCDSECRRSFLCRYLTGESHNSTICIKYIQGGKLPIQLK